jgi:uncharacterized protein (TIGR03067 family)
MRQRFLAGVIAASISVGLTMAPTRGAEPVIMKDLLGSWTCVSAVIDGKPLTEGTAKELRLTLTADRYKTERGEQVLFDSTYKVDASKAPAQIDMIGTEGDLKGETAPGILQLDGDTLTMCYVMPGKERPTAFESQPNTGATLAVWKRTKPN